MHIVIVINRAQSTDPTDDRCASEKCKVEATGDALLSTVLSIPKYRLVVLSLFHELRGEQGGMFGIR